MDERRRSPSDPDRVLVGLAAGVVLLVVLIVPGTAGWGTTYAGASTAALAADLAAGVGLVLTGLLLRQERAQRGLASLALVAGIAWFAADVSGWHDGPAPVRGIAAIAAAMLPPVLLHLSAASPPGHRMGRGTMSVCLVAYAVIVPLALAAALVTEPSFDGGCWRDCRSNPFLIGHLSGLAGGLRYALGLATLGCGLAMSAIAAGRLLGATRPARARLWPLLVATIALGAAVSVHALRVLRDPVERPRDPLDASLYLLVAGTVAVFAAALAWTVLRGRELVAALGDLARGPIDAGLGAEVRERLVRATGDRRLSIAYRFADPDRWVDADGVEVPKPAAAPDRAVTPMVRGGEVIAAVIHDPSILAPGDLEAALGPATRLAIDNERLRAGILAEVAALQTSRRAIVAAADGERMHLERDLHDGAQQRLLAVSYDLRMAAAAATGDGLQGAMLRLDALVATVRAVHEELRELAHGIYPAILAEAGLGQALETLARRSPIPLQMEVDAARADPETENSAYAAVVAALRDAAAGGATHARAIVRHRGDHLELILTDDASPERPAPDDLSDRVGAAGGAITCVTTAVGRRVEAALPCA